MGFASGLMGMGGGAGGSGYSGAASANVMSPVTKKQAEDAYAASQAALAQQQAFVTATQAQNGLQNQSDVYNQLQGVVAGTGPNPAQALLANATGANVANQSAMMAGQRGANANVGMIARQAAQQGSTIQQGAAGQAAALQAQQSLNALNSSGAMANTQAAQQQSATQAMTDAQLREQGNLLNSIGGVNNANVAMQSNINDANSRGSTGMQGGQGNMMGNMMGAVGQVLPMIKGLFGSDPSGGDPTGGLGGGGPDAGSFEGIGSGIGEAGSGFDPSFIGAKGGMVPSKPQRYDEGGMVHSQPMGPMSQAGQYFTSNPSQVLSGVNIADDLARQNPDVSDPNSKTDASFGAVKTGMNIVIGQTPFGPVNAGIQGFGKFHEANPRAIPAAIENWTDMGGEDVAKSVSKGGGDLGKGVEGAFKPLTSLMEGIKFAKGGKVPALVSPGEKYLPPSKVNAVKQGANPMKEGKTIPGKPKVGGAKDSYSNDTVKRSLDEGGIVIPRSVTQSKDADKKAMAFVQAVLAKNGNMPKRAK